MRGRFIKSILWWCLRLNSRWVLVLGRLLYGLKVQGREHLPSHGPLIVLIRPNARVGIFVAAFLCTALNRFYALAGGPAIVNMRFFSRLARQLGMLPAFKGKSLSAFPLMEGYRLLRQGEIFLLTSAKEIPWDGHLQPLLPGAAWLALRVHTPIIMVAVQGDYDIWPRWASRPHLTGKLVLKIGKPFYLCDDPCNRVTEAMLQEANQRLLAELERLSDGYMLSSKTCQGAMR
jgi:1-acyl-sn-glycerol-3-phosphate acyltransferase